MLLCLLFDVGAGLHLLDQTWVSGSIWQHGTQNLQWWGVTEHLMEHYTSAGDMNPEGAPKEGHSLTGLWMQRCLEPLAEARAKEDETLACRGWILIEMCHHDEVSLEEVS